MDVEEMFLLTPKARDFVFSRLADHGEEERKRHELALQRLQRTTDKWNKRKAQNKRETGKIFLTI